VTNKQKPRNYKVTAALARSCLQHSQINNQLGMVKDDLPLQTMLHNDTQNRREYVVRVLLKVVKSLTMDDAVTGGRQFDSGN